MFTHYFGTSCVQIWIARKAAWKLSDLKPTKRLQLAMRPCDRFKRFVRWCHSYRCSKVRSNAGACKERCPHADSNNRVRAGRIFFLTLCPKNLSLYEIHSAPTLVFSKFRVVVPLKNIQRHWGCNQRKVWSKTHCLTDLGPGTLSHC